MPARSNIPPEAFEEISSGKLGFREARRIYGIGHARYKKIQQRVETPSSVVPPPSPPPPPPPPPIAFRKRGRDTSGEILEDLHALFQGRPDLFLSHEEYKVLVGTSKTAETFYTFVHLRNFPRQLRELYRLQYHYFLAFGYVQDIAEMRVHTRDKTGFVVFERLLVEDYELFPPEYRKSRKPALAGTCRCGSKTHGKECILEGTAGGVSGGMDLPTCSAEQKTGEAQATVVPEERQHPEAGGTQEGQETGEAIVPEERQQPEAGGTQEGQETGEAIFRRYNNNQSPVEHKRAKRQERPMSRKNGNIQRPVEHKRSAGSSKKSFWST